MAAAAATPPADEAVGGGIPVIDLGKWLGRDSGDAGAAAAAAEECKRVAEGLHKYGILVLRDPRVSTEDNDNFLDMIEQYFEQPEADKMPDVHKELSYQVGATPSRTELPRDHCDRMKAFAEADKPLSLCPPEKDPKWRFFWRIGERPKETKFAELNAAPVHPKAFPRWGSVMDTWGTKLLAAVNDCAAMAAKGFGVADDAFTERMQQGAHLLAPTATDFKRFGAKGTVMAGFHYDLNFLTIHGRSRFPGLYIWTREGKKVLVRVPEQCLLIQAGKQFEYLTGGHVLAGFHEVCVVDETLTAIEKAKAAGKSLWRISSTLFGHLRSDTVLKPIEHFATAEAKAAYPALPTGAFVNAELEHINLAPPTPARALGDKAAAAGAAGAGVSGEGNVGRGAKKPRVGDAAALAAGEAE